MFLSVFEEKHFRESLAYMLDGLEAGRMKVLMALTWTMGHLPIMARDLADIHREHFAELLTELEADPAQREDILTEIVGIILDQMELANLVRELNAATLALKKRGLIVTGAGIDSYQINGAGSFTAEDILDKAALY